MTLRVKFVAGVLLKGGRLLCLHWCLFLGCPLSEASLDWTSKQQQIVGPIGAESVDFVFKFKHNGTGLLYLSAPRASCGCTVAKMSQEVFQPGQEGLVSGTYRAKGQDADGRVKIVISGYEVLAGGRVEFSDELGLDVSVARAITSSPSVVIWKKGDNVKFKSVRIELNKAKPMDLTIIAGLGGRFRGKLVSVTPKFLYELSIRPDSVDSDSMDVCVLEGVDETGRRFKSFIYLIVR